ncbi:MULTISPECIES: response regulator [Niastella]|uniref:Response regulator n=1 Tax=Niastella soli TaxID=2821487 RepID=A0ABS3YS09_9BACT|nr:response regulator [Niastella soli]MBO9200367.1 response regulator [Niastella soli]
MQQSYHHLLEKQIQNTLSGAQKYDPAVQKLLHLIDQAYRNYEKEQQQIEQAFSECEKQYQHILENQQRQNKEIEAALIRAKEQKEASARDLSGIKVLLVEDVEFNIMVAKKMITNWNGAVDIAENGVVAIDKVQRSEYDIVLMDLQMPVMDGYNATQHIRSFNDAIPIIALTATASADILQRTRELGLTDYLAKPFKPGELYEMIAKYSKIGG